MGYKAKKGVFKLFHKGRKSRKSRKSRGGGALSPADFDGSGVGTSGNQLQFLAGNAA
jgi:hypothetical protein